MEIQQAIEHARKVAEEKYTEAMLCHANPNDDELDGCIECAKGHEQLAHWLEKLQAYKSIGTLEECRELKEKKIAKKPKKMTYEPLVAFGWKYACPSCGGAVGENAHDGGEFTQADEYCATCGQAIDWSD